MPNEFPKPGRCNAYSKGGGYCWVWPRKGKKRCHFHGGAPGSGIPKSQRPKVLSPAAREAKAAMDQKRREAIEAGVLDKFPQGRKKRPRPGRDPIGATEIVAPGMPPTAVSSTTRRGAELGKAVDQGLAFLNRELADDTPLDDVGAYRRRMVNVQAAKTAINAQIRVDENELRAQKATKLGSLLTRLRNQTKGEGEP